MTTDPFTEAARAEAERRWSRGQADDHPLPAHARSSRRIGFEIGALWARTHLAVQEPTDAESIARKNLGDDAVDRLAAHFGVAQEPTDAEVQAAAIECVKFLFLTAPERPWEDPEVVEQWKPMARIALRSARAARRDEEKRAACGCDLTGPVPPAVHIVDRHEERR